MKRKNVLASKFLLCFLLLLTLVPMAFSDWVYSGDNVNEKQADVSSSSAEPCCYVGTAKNRKYYLKIEDALDATYNNLNSDIIFVIPGTNPTIQRNCTLSANDTLVISYDVDNPETRSSDVASLTDYSTFSDNVPSKLKNTVTLASDVTLTSYGTIEVGGQLSGGSGGGACGQTAGLYSKITLDQNASLISKGNLYVYGFIDEKVEDNNSKVILDSGSYTKYPLIVRDFRGGSNMLSFSTKVIGAKNNASPFNQIDVRNMAAYAIYKYGSIVDCLVNIYANKSQNASALQFIGKNGLFQIANENSYITSHVKKAPSDDSEVTSKNYTERITSYDTYGKINVGNVSLSMSGISFSLKNYYFPFCFRQQIECHPVLDKEGNMIEGGNVHLPAYYKLLPGSSLVIDKNVIVQCDGNVVVYDANQKASDGKTDILQIKTDTVKYSAYYEKIPAKIIVNGNFVSNGFGGKIYTQSVGAVVSISSASVKSGEFYTETGLLNTGDYPYANLSLQLYKYNESNKVVDSSMSSGDAGTYISNGENSAYGFMKKTSDRDINIVYKAGTNCFNSNTVTKTAKYYSYYGLLNTDDSSIKTFKQSNYMLKSYSVYTDSQSKMEIGLASGILVADIIFPDLAHESNSTIYVELNFVESIEITFTYNSDNNSKVTETLEYEKNGDNWNYVLKTGIDLGKYRESIRYKSYMFDGYDIYPGINEKNGTPARTKVTPEGTAINLADDDLKSTITKKYMYIHVNRKKQS